MTDKNYIRNLRIPTKDDPLRILVSACLLGVKCGVNGDNYGEYQSVLKLLHYDNVKFIQFCPEDVAFGTPREASEKMLETARNNQVELAIMMDVSAACGNHVIYDGDRYAENKKYQIGMGVCGAQLHRAGFKIISWREYESLEILYSRINPHHQVDTTAKDFDQHEWYTGYFGKNHKEENPNY
jgi:uncharacterized protein YbbK (DUF523 family)